MEAIQQLMSKNKVELLKKCLTSYGSKSMRGSKEWLRHTDTLMSISTTELVLMSFRKDLIISESSIKSTKLTPCLSIWIETRRVTFPSVTSVSFVRRREDNWMLLTTQNRTEKMKKPTQKRIGFKST